MRKLKLQMQVSLDGYVAGTNGEMDWMTWDWDEELQNYVHEITHPVDTILLGRKLAEGFIPTWKGMLDNPDTADEFSRKMVETPKIVFSRTLDHTLWENTRIANGSLAEEISRIKKEPGNDIIAYGGAELARNLIRESLIDELNIFVNPAALGSGMPIFDQQLKFSLIKTTAFPCGITALRYAPATAEK